MMSPNLNQFNFYLLEGCHTGCLTVHSRSADSCSHLSVASTQQRCSRAASAHDGVC